MVAYDLDGVLAEVPPASLFTKKWGRMNGEERRTRGEQLLAHYSRARLLHRPVEERFVVVSARKNAEDVATTTSTWLAFQGVEPHGLYLLDRARTLRNVIDFKVSVLRQVGAVEFTEDNRQVLAGVARLLPGLKLWWYKPDGDREPFVHR